MDYFSAIFSLLLLSPIASKHFELRVVTFNTYHSGSRVADGLSRIAHHIEALQADVVALQELRNKYVPRLLQLLGPNWRGLAVDGCAVLTTHSLDFLNLTNLGGEAIGARVKFAGQEILVFSVHLSSAHYGPEVACQLGSVEEILQGEAKRMAEISRIFAEIERFSDNWPVILAGDLNTPSHFDWNYTEDSHCGLIVPWPVTKYIAERGFLDAYRTLHPDPIRSPGLTWPAEEPEDRIDFVFYKEQNVTPEFDRVHSAKTVNWPSDHAAVVVDFEIAEAAHQYLEMDYPMFIPVDRMLLTDDAQPIRPTSVFVSASSALVLGLTVVIMS